MRTDNIMMRADDDKMRADNDRAMAHEYMKTSYHFLPNSYKTFNNVKLELYILSQKLDIDTNTLSQTMTHKHCIYIDDFMKISDDKSLVQILN